MAIIDSGSSAAGKANVDANYQLAVATNTDPLKAGAMRMFSESDDGSVTGEATCRSPETSHDFRLRGGLDMQEFNDTFNYTNQDTGKYRYDFITLTMSLSGGALTTNPLSGVAINTAARMRSWRLFPVWGQQTPLYSEFSISFTAALATNTTHYLGHYIDSGSSPFTPTDGSYFKITSAGVVGVVNFNNTEAATDPFTFSFTTNRVYQFLLVTNEREVEFWIDDVLYATKTVQTGNGQPFMSASLPLAIGHAIGGVAAGSALSMKVWDTSVQFADIAHNVPLGVQMALMGQGLQVQQAASTGGQLTTYALGAEPAAVTLTASTAPATNTLGGLFILPAAITTAASDYPLYAWLNPAGTTAIHGKTFICTGLRMGELSVTTVLVGGPLIIPMALGFGSTAATLATTETTTFTTATTKIARKIPLGTQAVPATSAVGAIIAGYSVDFGQAPIVINPGEYLHIIIRVLGTNLTSGVIRGSVAIFGYFR